LHRQRHKAVRTYAYGFHDDELIGAKNKTSSLTRSWAEPRYLSSLTSANFATIRARRSRTTRPSRCTAPGCRFAGRRKFKHKDLHRGDACVWEQREEPMHLSSLLLTVIVAQTTEPYRAVWIDGWADDCVSKGFPVTHLPDFAALGFEVNNVQGSRTGNSGGILYSTSSALPSVPTPFSPLTSVHPLYHNAQTHPSAAAVNTAVTMHIATQVSRTGVWPCSFLRRSRLYAGRGLELQQSQSHQRWAAAARQPHRSSVGTHA
jgi:hypothetical protein